MVVSQPLPSSPTVVQSVHPTPLSPPRPLRPPARVPGPLTRISIEPENMDETLRQPMYQELTPFAGRRLGDFEWVAFEEVLNRWTIAIKEVVTAQRCCPPNPTSQWARRRRRREQEACSPSPSSRASSRPFLDNRGTMSDLDEQQGLWPSLAGGQAGGMAEAGCLPPVLVPTAMLSIKCRVSAPSGAKRWTPPSVPQSTADYTSHPGPALKYFYLSQALGGLGIPILMRRTSRGPPEPLELSTSSLVITGAAITLTEDSATLETKRHKVTWDKRKLLLQVLKEAIHELHLRDL
ncbi:hypothetical protein EMCRGX_G005562 [Ephydatia muelleri]